MRAWILALVLLTSAYAEVSMTKVAWGGWPNCYRLTNGEVELIVTADVGPRIMRYAFVGGPNLFAEFREQLGKSDEKEWQARGGHRLWMGPEVIPDTYALDNQAVDVSFANGTLRAVQKVEPETGLQKSLSITLEPAGSRVRIVHTLRNAGTKPRELAAWALTMMAPGGVGIHMLPPRGEHPKDLLPVNPLVMWSYTDLSDPRWIFTSKYIGLRQDPKNARPQKVGSFNAQTIGAYFLKDLLFIKRYTADTKARYPDFQSSFETFTNDQFLELETLGPLVTLPAGASVDHTEVWTLHRGVQLERFDDAGLDRVLLPLLK